MKLHFAFFLGLFFDFGAFLIRQNGWVCSFFFLSSLYFYLLIFAASSAPMFFLFPLSHFTSILLSEADHDLSAWCFLLNLQFYLYYRLCTFFLYFIFGARRAACTFNVVVAFGVCLLYFSSFYFTLCPTYFLVQLYYFFTLPLSLDGSGVGGGNEGWEER